MKRLFLLLVSILLLSYSCKKEVEGTKNKGNIDSQTIINYRAVYELINKRYDGGIIYYLLIDQVNLENDEFKKNIKTLIKKIVKEKGVKISLNIYDNNEALELSYKQYGSMTLQRLLTKGEMNILSNHYIAGFGGDLDINAYLNTLMFFPAAFTETANVGKYVEIIEFNP